MKFSDLRAASERLRVLLRESTGRELVTSISVDEPNEPQDELHFLKLVSWCYVFFFEASQPATKYIVSLLRTGEPAEHKAVSSTIEMLNNIRTVHFHNLSEQSRRDDHKRRQVRIWFQRNGGGDPQDWGKCCISLCSEATEAVKRISATWQRVTSNSEDTAFAVQELIATVEREWPPHVFDRMVDDAASDIGLSGLDCVRYRDSRLERWRELVGFFENREHAKAAIQAAIHRELVQIFGSPKSRSLEPNLLNLDPEPPVGR